jgi:hypothetical protein
MRLRLVVVCGILPLVLALIVTPTSSAAVTTLMPYGGGGYSYKVVPTGALPGFPSNYDSSGFASGTAPFSSGPSGCGYPQATNWPSNTDLLAVHTVDVPAGATDVSVSVGIDNDMVVYWDGTQIGSNSHDGCASNDSFTYQVSQSLSQPGQHDVAFRAIDRGDQTYFDATVRAGSEAPMDAAGPSPTEVRAGGSPSEFCLVCYISTLALL